MIRELLVKGFAIIERLELSLGPGLSCLTGETGAGKSILVDAISAALGGRAGPECIRGGPDAEVQVLFDISSLPELRARLEELGLGQDGELIVRRVLSTSGRGRAYVNGSLVNLATLQEVGNHLVDMHGQHEHQSLFSVERHLELLDAYCALQGRLAEYRAAYNSLSQLKKKLDALTGRAMERAQRLDLLRFQKREIDEAAPRAGEDEELLSERTTLMHADRLRSLASSVLDGLNDSEGSAVTALGEAHKAAREIASIVPEQSEGERLIEAALVSAREACAGLRAFVGSLDADPERLSAVEERLDALSRLKKKYGPGLEDVVRYREGIDGELASLENSEEELAGLTSEISRSEAALLDMARTLTESRAKGASGFGKKVEAELAGLGMGKARFEVRFDRLPSPGPRGFEKAEFIIAANPGEEPRPLAKVASGGELSRVMLALKVVLSRVDNVPTLIFDEVDSGVGGATATVVGRKLKEASAGRQVLCITHLPQIASQASGHYLVEKRTAGGRTAAGVRRLGKDERVREVARMLGGEGSSTASAHAEELVRQGEMDG